MGWEEEASGLVTSRTMRHSQQHLPQGSSLPAPDRGPSFSLRWSQAGQPGILSPLELRAVGAGVTLSLQQVRLTLQINLVMLGQGPGKYWKLHPAWEPVGVRRHGRVTLLRVLWIPVYLKCLPSSRTSACTLPTGDQYEHIHT